jgi:ribosomal protein S18 acetylase RimI-like enzyme
MSIRHAATHELEIRGPKRPWLEAACALLRRLPDHPHSRVLIAEEDGRPTAVLGLRLMWAGEVRLVKATICVLAVDPEYDRQGMGSRLVRFAEGIARIRGCARVDVAPDLEEWGDGRCWPGLGYFDPGAGLHKVLQTPIHEGCA